MKTIILSAAAGATLVFVGCGISVAWQMWREAGKDAALYARRREYPPMGESEHR